jgi:hypothetical protein
MSYIIFFRIGALKVFADLGALIEKDEAKEIKFMDIPTDMIQNNILNHLKKDETLKYCMIKMMIFYKIYYVENLRKRIT